MTASSRCLLMERTLDTEIFCSKMKTVSKCNEKNITLSKNWVLQSCTKYLRQALALYVIAHHMKSSLSIFQKNFTSIDQTVILGERLATRLWKFDNVLIILIS